MEKDNKNIICGGGNVVAREEKAIRVLVSTVYWLSPAAIRLFPFLVREVPLEEIYKLTVLSSFDSFLSSKDLANNRQSTSTPLAILS